MTQTFRMPAAPESAFAILPAELPRPVAWLMSLVRRWANNTTYEVSADGLRVRGTMYGRRIRRKDLRVAEAELLAPLDTDERMPERRTNGIGLPGYGAGWFRLRSGEKALVFLTEGSSVVYIPTRRSYALVLSVDDPERFLLALRA